MKKIKLNWLDIVILSILGLCLVFCFIPVSTSDDGVYSLVSYLSVASQNGQGMRIVAFVLYVVLTLASAALLVFNQRGLFKTLLFFAAAGMLLLCVVGWPTRIFSTVIGIIYLSLDLVVIIVDAIIRRRDIVKRKESEQ